MSNKSDPVPKSRSPKGPTALVRAEIEKIPENELGDAKPARVIDALKARGIEITSTIKTTTSNLLKKRKEELLGIVTNAKVKGKRGKKAVSAPAQHSAIVDRLGAGMQFVEVCGWDFEVVRKEIARLEEFAKKAKGV